MLTNFSFIKNVVHTSCLSISFMTVGPFRGVMVKITRLFQQDFVFLNYFYKRQHCNRKAL